MAEAQGILMPTIDALRDLIWKRDNGICGICNQPVTRTEMHMDHIQPRSLGGSDSFNNLRAAHGLCNIRRGNGREVVATTPYQLRAPRWILDVVRREAANEKVSMNSLMIRVLSQAVEAAERTEPKP